MWCVPECDREASILSPGPLGAVCVLKKKNYFISLCLLNTEQDTLYVTCVYYRRTGVPRIKWTHGLRKDVNVTDEQNLKELALNKKAGSYQSLLFTNRCTIDLL